MRKICRQLLVEYLERSLSCHDRYKVYINKDVYEIYHGRIVYTSKQYNDLYELTISLYD